ncbi:hypothetical protein J3E69DRAFT_332633 [Trichoderma sp. SZMC 28015]
MTMHSYVQMRQQLSARRACAVWVSLSIGRQSFIARCFAGVGFLQQAKATSPKSPTRHSGAGDARISSGSVSNTDTVCVCTCDWPHRQPSNGRADQRVPDKTQNLAASQFRSASLARWPRTDCEDGPAHSQSFIPAPRRKCRASPLFPEIVGFGCWALSSALTC